MAGREIAISPGHAKRSRFAPSVDTEVPFEIVKLLYQVVIWNGESEVTSPKWTRELPCFGSTMRKSLDN